MDLVSKIGNFLNSSAQTVNKLPVVQNIERGAQQVGQQAVNLLPHFQATTQDTLGNFGKYLAQSNPLLNNPINSFVAQTPNYLQQGAQSLDKLMPQNLAGHVGRGLVDAGAGFLSIPGTLAQVGQNPQQIVPTAKNLIGNQINSYKADAGFGQNGQWSINNIGKNLYDRPVETALDVLPFAGAFGKGAMLSKAKIGGTLDDAALNEFSNKLVNLSPAAKTNPLIQGAQKIYNLPKELDHTVRVAVDQFKQGNIGSPVFNKTIQTVTDHILPQFTNLPTTDQAKILNNILHLKDKIMPQDIHPAIQPLVDSVKHDLLQTGKINLGAKVGKNISSEGIVTKTNKIKVNNFPTQTEIKNKVTQEMGNPDLYTQRNIKLKDAGLTGQPTPKEQASISEFNQILKSKDAQVNEALKGGQYKIDEGIGQPKNPKKVKLPVGDTQNKVSLTIHGNTEKEKVLSAVANSERILNSVRLRGKDAYIAGRNLSEKDKKLVELYQEGKPIENLAQKAENPKAFTGYMNKMKDYYDYRLASDRALGGLTNKRENYIHQYWDLSNQKDLERFNELAKQRGLQKWNGFSAQPRIFKTYKEGAAAGFKRLYPNAVEDLKQDYEGASRSLSSQALKRGLELGVPDKIAEAGHGITGKNKPFVNTNIPGLEGISLHPEVNRLLKGYQPVTSRDLFKEIKDSGVIQGVKDTGVIDSFLSLYDHAGGSAKQFLLNFSGFHSINISANYAGANILNPIRNMKGLAESIPSFLSESATQKIISNFKNKMIPRKDYSVFEAALRTGQKMDRGLPAKGIGKLNVFGSLQKAIFDRELYTLRLHLNDLVFGDGKLDPESIAGINAGKEIDKILGEINIKTMNINPNAMKWASRGLLAPQFTVSKYSTLADMGTATKAQRSLAIKAVIGKSIALGTVSTLGTLMFTGKFPTLQQIFTNYTTDPSIQTNLTNPKGRKQDIALPNSFISEPLRPIAGDGGLTSGSTEGLTHYGQARLNPLLSNGLKIYTNKDYYGNPIIDANSTKSPASQLAQNVGIGMLPIGVQNVVNASQGKITPTQAAINIAGLRTKTSPNDPTALYFKHKDQEYKKLAPEQQHLVDAIPKQDPTDPGAKQLKYELIGRDPAVWNYFKNIAVADANGDTSKVDPLYTVPYDQAKAVITYEAQNPGSKDKSALYKANPQIGQILGQRAVYFQNNPLPDAQPNPAPQASDYVQQQMDAKNWKDPQVKAYLDANTAYNDSLRSQMGLTPIAQAGGYSPFSRKRKIPVLKFTNIAKGTSPKKIKFGKVGSLGSIKMRKTKSLTFKSPSTKLRSVVSNKRKVKFA